MFAIVLIRDSGKLSHRRHDMAVKGMMVQVSAHEDFTAILPTGCAEKWAKQVEEWEEDHEKSNPYFLPAFRK